MIMTQTTVKHSLSLTTDRLKEEQVGSDRKEIRQRNDGSSEDCSWAWMDAGKHYDWMDRHAPLYIVQDWVI